MTVGPGVQGHEHCLVCSDNADVVSVLEPGLGDAICEDACGRRLVVAVELVLPVQVGDHLLVHAGAAIARLPRPKTSGGR